MAKPRHISRKPTHNQVKAVCKAMTESMQGPVPEGVRPGIRANYDERTGTWHVSKTLEHKPKGV